MILEQILEIAFLQEVRKEGQLWVAKSGLLRVYADELDIGYSLPVWSNRERAADYLRLIRPLGATYEPVAVDLDDFTNRWLSDKMMGVSEVQLNPDGKSTKVLVVTPEEFKTDVAEPPAGGGP